jgi:hypothetical protein
LLPPLTSSYTHIALTQKMRRIVNKGVGYGLSLESISALTSRALDSLRRDHNVEASGARAHRALINLGGAADPILRRTRAVAQSFEPQGKRAIATQL